jgi:hypothetical protein
MQLSYRALNGEDDRNQSGGIYCDPLLEVYLMCRAALQTSLFPIPLTCGSLSTEKVEG